ncbi:Excision repair cross-complementing rodent repair deficiency, complementation group 4 [Cyanidiococcus yangmingshanensis]|uniref:Excision repair cross-complementing rodent repair deficiency, complementation group 4 n=1 Tax=Cyanidiococcus yangmingshanensis TaxID=2690220 RepID=A0A7J7IFA6_9RHOD|nr:Excision repair cross-complementing rodent repair deficiency, complementation group 4 [Cyanidiococcus yangmingshanensis]
MLPYVKTAVTEVLSGNSSLTVFARGLDLEALVAVVAANKLTHSEERPMLALNFPKPVFQRFCQTLAAHPAKFPLHLLPRHISSSLSAVERNEVYRCGGVVSATPRTFAVDILQAISKLRDPAETNLKPVNYLGVLLFNAHEITDCRSEAFVVRLFQEYVCIRDLQNTFIFAFSDSAQVLSRGFHTAEKLMRLLGLERLLLFPRFHVDVITSLEYDQNPCDRLEPTHLTDAPIQGGTIELLEIHQPMTALMNAIYDEIWALIRVCFSELRKSAPGLDLDESDLRGSRSNTNLLQTAQRLSQAWRHLNSRARQLLLDIQCLYRILICLLNDDCVTFLSYLESIREVHGSGSYWLMMERAQNMYLLSKERVFHGSLQHEEHVQEVLRSLSTRQSSAKVRDLLEISKKLDLTPEPNSKWMLLRDLLDEIINSMRNAGNPSGSAYLPGFRILVLGREPNTMKFLSDFLGGGESPKCALLRKFIRYLEVQGAMRNLHRPSTSRNPEALALDATENGNQSSSSSSSDHSDAVEDSDSCAKGQRTGASWRVNPHEDSSEGLREMPPLDTDSYASNDRDYRPWSQQDTNLSTNESALKFEILLKAYGRGNANTRTGNLIGPSTVLPFLMEIQPCAVILLDPTLQHVREIEVYQAAYSRYSKIRMYTIFYEDSFEYEQYRKTVADEQQAFQTLIRHKASMAVRLDQSLEPSRAGDCSRMMTRWQQSDSHMLAEQSSESI